MVPATEFLEPGHATSKRDGQGKAGEAARDAVRKREKEIALKRDISDLQDRFAGLTTAAAGLRRLPLLLAPLALLALWAVLGASAAQAAETIAEQGVGAGKVTTPEGVAVNQSGTGGVEPGTLYVADRDNRRIDRFGPAGDFQLAWGWAVADGKSQELQVCGPAAEPPTKRCFYGERDSNPAESAGAVSPLAVAVEPSTGDVYASDANNRRVSKFSPSGQFLLAFGGGVASGGALGTGNLEAGSTTVKGVTPTHKAFLAGQILTAGGALPPGTEIIGAGGTLSLSKPATETVSGATLIAAEDPGNVPTNEQQLLTLAPAVSSGTFKLRFGSAETTADIPFNATPGEVQSALAALPAIGAGNVLVGSSNPGGGAEPGGPYEIEFTGERYADTDVGQLSVSSTATPKQIVALEGAAAGTFTLSFKGKTSAPIPFNASAAEVQSALAALSTIGSGNVTVTGSAGGPWVVTFTGSLSGEQPLMSVDSSGLTGATPSASVSPSPSVTTTRQGALAAEACTADCLRGQLAEMPGVFAPVANAVVEEQGSPPWGLAFDSSGDLWVASGGGRLQRFDSSGHFLSGVPVPADTQVRALAIDPTADDFYILGPPGHNESQAVKATGSTKGEYTLSFEGQTTAALPGDAGSAEIQAALEALPTIGSGNVSVTRIDENLNFPATVAFIHDLGGRDVPQLTASGGSPAVTVEANRQGNPGSVEKLDSSGALIETLDDAPGDIPRALAGDSAGNLYVGDTGLPYHFLKFNSAGEQESQFGAGQVAASVFANGGPLGNGIALDESSGALYAGNSSDDTVKRYAAPEPGPAPENQRAEDVEPTTATLAAELNPEGHETTYFFEYGTSESYGQSTPVETLPVEGFDAETVKAGLEGLIPNTEYHFRLVATDHGNPSCGGGECIVHGPDTVFATRTTVGIEDQRVTELAAHDATLNARLDPLGVKGEWWLEYDTVPYGEGEAPHGTHVSGGSLPASFGAIPVAVVLEGLEASTAYHYRFAASDVRDGNPYTAYGVDQSFVTQPGGLGFALSDNRAWEMVSPPEKHGGRIATFEGAQGGQVQAAADGDALAYLSFGSLEAFPEGNRLIEQSSQLSRRETGGRWSTVDITPPHTEAAVGSIGAALEYKLFSTNLERSLLEPRDCTPLAPSAGERTPYVRENTEPPAYVPLVLPSEVPPGTEFNPLCGGELKSKVQVQGASPDLSHVVLQSNVPLAPGAAESSLYEATASTLEPLSVKPTGEGGATVRARLGSGNGSARGAVSADGSRVFWSAVTSQGAPTGLYLRDTAGDETLRLDEVQEGGFGTGKVAPLFQGASADGSVAFFTDTQNLTEDANEEGADLYRRLAQGTGGCEAAGGCLEDLSAGVAHLGESAEVQGLLPGFGKDGSRAYFVALGVLDGEPNAVGESASRGQPNLYAWSASGGVRFVAKLSAADHWDWADGNFAYRLTAEASPSGRYLAFMSALPLTGYDNRAAGSGVRSQEVFRYDAATEELTCVSCNPSGARPRPLLPGPQAGQLSEEFDPSKLWEGKSVAAVVPEPTVLSIDGASLYQPRYVHDDGRVFFNAADSLVGADSNGNGDVYQYEPSGTGSCSASTVDPGTALVPGGCLSLISSGDSEGTAAFLDASEGASDVFFYTPARLSVTDEDSEMDVYDARTGGEPARLERPAECLGEACQPPASPPGAQTPASAAFRGPGNLHEAPPGRRPCPKGKRRVRRKGTVRCVKRAQKHSKHHRRHHRTHRDGRARR